MRLASVLVVWLASNAVALVAHAGNPDCRAASTERTGVLVELFTSEGCNSCPPADRWLSSLGRGPATPANVVLIAWHVDYWDYIGWKDRFAQAAFSDRQRSLAQIRGDRFVYTPQVLVQGRDYRRWARGGFDAAVAGLQSRPARARIALAITGRSQSAVEIEARAGLLDAESRQAPASYALILASTASGFSTEVGAGENSGRRLEHDHVAFGWRGPIPFGRDGELTRRERLALPTAAPGKSAVVAFVQSARTAEVLQALALPVCPG